MKVHQVVWIAVISIICPAIWADDVFEGYHYGKPSKPFEIPKFITLKKAEILSTSENIEVVFNKDSEKHSPIPQTTGSNLPQFINEDQEFIYRPSSNPANPSHHVTGSKHHEEVKRLKLHPSHIIETNTTTTIRCGQQSTVESLEIAYQQRSRNRPLERRLAPYNESPEDSSYFLN